MRKFITHQNLDLIAQEPERYEKPFFQSSHVFAAKMQTATNLPLTLESAS